MAFVLQNSNHVIQQRLLMDKELKEVFDRIKHELTHLYMRWIIYKQLYGTSEYRLELLNKTTSNVFTELQWLLIDNMILSLSKLTDSAEMRGNWNLSLEYLLDEIQKINKNELPDELRSVLKELNDSIEHFRSIRNKRIAHNDLAVAIDNEESPLPGVSRDDITKALELVMNFLNKIEYHYFDSTTQYDMTILPLTNDGRALLIWLQKALAYEQLEDAGLIEYGYWRSLGKIDA